MGRGPQKRFTDEEIKERRRIRALVRYEENKDEINAKKRNRRKAIKDEFGCNEKEKQYNKYYRETHKEEIKEIQKQYHIENKERLAQYSREFAQSFAGKYSEYKSSAKSRNINFSLTKEEFSEFWQKKCIYCGDDIETIGIDRIDSSKGYEIGNIVSCCTKCNYIKLHYSIDMFYLHIEKIINFTKNPFVKNNCIVVKKKNRKTKYTNYKSRSTNLNREFTLTKEEFLEITTTNCAYCGHDIDLGIDRIDSSKGYIQGNCASCCEKCNRMKLNYTLSDFLYHLIKINNRKDEALQILNKENTNEFK